MFSIICCYNDKKILEDFLLSSLKEQTEDYQLLLIDNTQNEFSGVAKAYNSVFDDIENENVIFLNERIEKAESEE